jgi:hypothetical protein
MRITGLILLVLLSAPALPAPTAEAGPRRLTCGTVDDSVAKTADVEYAGIVPGRGLAAEDFADGGLLVVADPSLYQITDDPVGVLTRAARNWEIPGTMVKFRIVMGPVEGGNIVYAENIRQAARATVGRPGWGKRGSLFMVLDVPFSRGDDSLVAVMTHEMGHWLGFDHSFLGSTVMFPVLTDRINWVDPDQVAKATARYGVAPNALGEVRGHVTRSGAPLVGARINLLGSNGRTAFGTFAGDDGAYHVPVFAGTYRLVVDPNDGPAVDGNFIGTYPGGPLDFATHEVPGQIVVSAGQTVPVDVEVPAGGDVAFRITTAEPTTCGPGAGSQGVSIYYEGATPAEIAGVDALSPDVHIFNVTDSGGKIAIFFDVEPGALPGGRTFRLRKTNGAVAIVPGIVGVVAPLFLEAPHYALEAGAGAELTVSWVDNLLRDETSTIVVSASVDGGFGYEEIGRVPPERTSLAWRPDAGLLTSALRLRIEALDAVGSRLAVDESIFNVGLGLPARGATGEGADVVAPEVRVVSPNGGETLVGGEEIRLAWSAFDDLGIAEQQVEVSVDGGRQWTSLGGFGPAVRAATWVPDRAASDAVLVRVTARDRAGNAGTDSSDAAARVRLRPTVSRVVLKAKGDGFALKVKGSGLAAGAVVRINGEVVGVPVTFAGGTLKVRGDAAALHLRPAGEPNTLVVEVEGLASVEAVF